MPDRRIKITTTGQTATVEIIERVKGQIERNEYKAVKDADGDVLILGEGGPRHAKMAHGLAVVALA